MTPLHAALRSSAPWSRVVLITASWALLMLTAPPAEARTSRSLTQFDVASFLPFPRLQLPIYSWAQLLRGAPSGEQEPLDRTTQAVPKPEPPPAAQQQPAPAQAPQPTLQPRPAPPPEQNQQPAPKPAPAPAPQPQAAPKPVPEVPRTQSQPQPPSAAKPAPASSSGGWAAITLPAAGPCIVTPGETFRVLAVGDSITQGSVPSRGSNMPYTNRLQEVLPGRLRGVRLQVDNAAIGETGMFQKPKGQTVPDAAESFLSRQSYDLVVVMVGINDLLAGGRRADEVMGALKTFYERITRTGASVFAVSPLAAPGFVGRGDGKEAQRRQLAVLMGATVKSWQERTKGQGPQLYFLNPEAHGLDFYGMSDGERRRLMDDGLHLSQQGYQRLGELVAEAITQQLC